MSRSRTSRKKRIRVSIPAVNLGLLGERGMDEARTKVEEKQEELQVIRLDADIIRERQRRDKLEAGEEPVERASEDKLGDKLLDEVVIPMVKTNLNQPEARGTDSVAEAAIKLADKALDKERGREPRSEGSTITEVINSLTKLKDFVSDDSTVRQLNDINEKLKELEKGKGKESDELDLIDKVLNIYDRVEKRMKPSEGGSQEGYYEFEKWKVEHNRRTSMQDRAWTLRLRQQDKEHDARLAELGIQRERTEILRDGLKTIGKSVVEGITDEDFEDETPTRRKTSGRARLWRGTCQCGETILVPPEGQVEGREFRCPKCDAKYEWHDE